MKLVKSPKRCAIVMILQSHKNIFEKLHGSLGIITKLEIAILYFHQYIFAKRRMLDM